MATPFRGRGHGKPIGKALSEGEVHERVQLGTPPPPRRANVHATQQPPPNYSVYDTDPSSTTTTTSSVVSVVAVAPRKVLKMKLKEILEARGKVVSAEIQTLEGSLERMTFNIFNKEEEEAAAMLAAMARAIAANAAKVREGTEGPGSREGTTTKKSKKEGPTTTANAKGQAEQGKEGEEASAKKTVALAKKCFNYYPPSSMYPGNLDPLKEKRLIFADMLIIQASWGMEALVGPNRKTQNLKTRKRIEIMSTEIFRRFSVHYSNVMNIIAKWMALGEEEGPKEAKIPFPFIKEVTKDALIVKGLIVQIVELRFVLKNAGFVLQILKAFYDQQLANESCDVPQEPKTLAIHVERFISLTEKKIHPNVNWLLKCLVELDRKDEMVYTFISTLLTDGELAYDDVLNRIKIMPMHYSNVILDEEKGKEKAIDTETAKGAKAKEKQEKAKESPKEAEASTCDRDKAELEETLSEPKSDPDAAVSSEEEEVEVRVDVELKIEDLDVD